MTDRSGKMEHISEILRRILPLKLGNVKESKLDLTPIKVPYLGKCS